MKHCEIQSPMGKAIIGNDRPLFLIAGPCQMENKEHALLVAQELKSLSIKHQLPIIYKTSFDKANRSSLHGKRGIGIDAAMPVFDEIRESLAMMVLTDIHTAQQCELVAQHVDVLQIPAFLCRQTDLLLAAAKTDAIINVKKGQFLAPWDIKNVVDKLQGAKSVWLTERGISFGYNCLVNDFRAIPTMAEQTSCPIIFDATHSVQQPGGLGNSSGGERKFVPTLARAAAAVGVAGIFVETHPDPDNSPSDGPNMIPLADMDQFIKDIKEIDQQAKQRKSLHGYC